MIVEYFGHVHVWIFLSQYVQVNEKQKVWNFESHEISFTITRNAMIIEYKSKWKHYKYSCKTVFFSHVNDLLNKIYTLTIPIQSLDQYYT